MKYSYLLLLSLFIQSCASVQSYSDVKNNDVLNVTKPLVIPADHARVTIQYGKVTPVSSVDVYYARCWFISRVIKKETQLINPGKFTILKVRETFDSVTLPTIGFPFAALSMSIGSSVSSIEYATEMDIVSASQPDINRLICSHFEDPADAMHLTLEQINTALGGLARVTNR